MFYKSEHGFLKIFDFLFWGFWGTFTGSGQARWPGQAGLRETPMWPGQASHRDQLASQSTPQEGKRDNAHAQASPAVVAVHTSPLQNTRPTTNCHDIYIYIYMTFGVDIFHHHPVKGRGRLANHRC